MVAHTSAVEILNLPIGRFDRLLEAAIAVVEKNKNQ